MIRKTLAIAVIGMLALVGLAPAATAQYPPTVAQLSCQPPSPAAGQQFTCTVTGLPDGTVVTFTISPSSSAGFAFLPAQDTTMATATSSGGQASATFVINTPGTYNVTATYTLDGERKTLHTTITVQAADSGKADGAPAAGTTTGGTTTGGGLAATGADGTGTLLAIAGGAILIGGLAVIGARARRQTKGVTL